MVKKGAAMAEADNVVYAAKGNNTTEWWAYAPTPNAWSQLPDVPMALKQGTGAATVMVGDTACVYVLMGDNTFSFYRYNTLRAANPWDKMADAPAGLSGKAYKKGSCLAAAQSYSSYGSDSSCVYALKGTYNEFYRYNVATNTWTTLPPLPLIGNSGTKKKAGDGTSLACLNGTVYCLKGNNTLEYWTYTPDSSWGQAEDMLIGLGRNVKAGGALVAAWANLYALKGNNTFEFYVYNPPEGAPGF